MNRPVWRRGALALAVLALTACSSPDPDALIASARDRLAKNDRKGAMIELKTALQEAPGAAEARFLLGKALLDDRQPGPAAIELRKALDAGHPRQLVVPLLITARVQEGKAREAVAEFGRLPHGDAALTADTLAAIGQAYLQMDQRSQAADVLQQALTKEAGHAQTRLMQARLAWASGQREQARDMVQALVADQPNMGAARTLLGQLQQADGKFDEALASFRKAYELDPLDISARSAATVVHLSRRQLEAAQLEVDAARQAAPNRPEVQLLQGQVAFEKADYKSAREISERLLKIAPDSPTVLVLAGSSELKGGSVKKAQSHLGKVVSAEPENRVARLLLAQAFLQNGQADQASQAIAPLLERGQKDPTALAMQAQALMLSGEFSEAESLYRRSAELNPRDIQVQTALGVAQLRQGDFAQGLAQLQRTAEGTPGHLPDLVLISEQLRRRKFDEALVAIDRLAKKPQEGNPALVPYLRGLALTGKGRVDEARTAFEQSVKADQRYFSAVARLAGMDVAAGQIEVARQRFEAARKAMPDDARPLLALSDIAVREKQPEKAVGFLTEAIRVEPTLAMPRLMLVDLHLRAKDTSSAMTAAQNAVAALPDSAVALDALAKAQVAAGQRVEALATLGKLAGMRPKNAGPHLAMAQLHLQREDTSQALAALQRARSAQPESLPAAEALAALLVRTGKLDEALEVARSTQKQFAAHSAGFVFEGDVQAARKHPELALAAYRQGLTKIGAPVAAVRLHDFLAAQHPKDATTFVDNWIKDHPEDALFIRHAADRALAAKQNDRARVLYERLVGLQPKNPVALNNLAWVLATMGQPGAVQRAQEAVALAPDAPSLHDTLAQAYASEGQGAKAIEAQRRAVELAPQDATLRLKLAKFYLDAGQRAPAQKELDQLAKLGDGFARQAEVKQLLARTQ